MMMSRESGVLLHPTSLPGLYGIGDLGESAYRFIDMIAGAHQKLWQILPLGPVGFGFSPYQCFSAFAGNPLLISPDRLHEEGLIDIDQSDFSFHSPADRVDYDAAGTFREKVMRAAFKRFRQSSENQADFVFFVERNSFWLTDYAIFQTIRTIHPGLPWTQWPQPLRDRNHNAIQDILDRYADEITYHQFVQYIFFRQWLDIKRYANEKGVRIIGDMPIFVSHDSADVWSYRDLFKLKPDGKPEVVAGVPPDYFSKTGQKWGNPLYRWDVSAADGHRWWLKRFEMLFEMVDIVRIDHFRGFEKYWEIPSSDSTAENGRWVDGPGAPFFQTILDTLGNAEIIAEDLGIITPEVEKLRDQFGFPGMKILQFAFGSGPENPYLPHNYVNMNCVVYTGTHDNDTTIGWWRSETSHSSVQKHVAQYLGHSPLEINWDLIHLASSSIAQKAIFPAQDILGLDSKARMNFPGKSRGNWLWRMEALHHLEKNLERLAEITECFGRR